MPPAKRRTTLVLLGAAALLVLVGTPLLPGTVLTWESVFRPAPGETGAIIFWDLRLPRACLGFLAGAGLAVSGMVFQALFRNAMATPFTLGVSSGASLGAGVCIVSGVTCGLPGLPGTTLAAALGALMAIGLVFAIARAKGGFAPTELLLAGVAISFSLSGLLLFTQHLARVHESFQILHWLMGGLETVHFTAVRQLAPLLILCLGVIALRTEELDLLALGDTLAAGRGASVKRDRQLLFLVTSLAVGAIVSLCGPIGFVGLIVPHTARLLVGPEHRVLLPASILLGGAFLVLCDGAARVLTMPIGVLTSLLGGPFFLWILLRRGGAGRV